MGIAELGALPAALLGPAPVYVHACGGAHLQYAVQFGDPEIRCA
ncbi:hypothetical protein [Streptomyces roseifaciens]|nr:hypothetical protein [Streptomyces roseifaciens]